MEGSVTKYKPTNPRPGMRVRAYARLMLAYVMGEVINIGYDNSGSCMNGWIRAHRIG